METTDVNATVNLQLKTFQVEYQTIQKKTKRIEKQTNPTIKKDYIYRQNRDYTILLRKIQHWLSHYKNDVVNAIDIVINNHMLNQRPRPFRCKPPVCDHHNRYYFGRTVGHRKTLAIRSNLEGAFLIQGWLQYDAYSGASIEQFESFVAYTENNVASFITDISVADEVETPHDNFVMNDASETEVAETYKNQIISSALVTYSDNTTTDDNFNKCDTDDETDNMSEEMEYRLVVYNQKEKADDDDDEKICDPYTDDDTSVETMKNSCGCVATDNATADEATIHKSSYIEQQGLYIHHVGLKQHLEEHFPHATIDVSKLIQSKFNRRARLYTLKEGVYKKLTTTPIPDDVTMLKVQCDMLRKMLLKLWKDRQFVCTPSEYLSHPLSVQNKYQHVVDGCV